MSISKKKSHCEDDTGDKESIEYSVKIKIPKNTYHCEDDTDDRDLKETILV